MKDNYNFRDKIGNIISDYFNKSITLIIQQVIEKFGYVTLDWLLSIEYFVDFESCRFDYSNLGRVQADIPQAHKDDIDKAIFYYINENKVDYKGLKEMIYKLEGVSS